MFDVNGSRNSSPSSYTHTQRWLSLTAREPVARRGGGALWLVRSLHTTEEVLLHFPSLTTRKKKKLCIPQKRYTEFFFVVLKPWFFQTAVYLETSYRPMSYVYDFILSDEYNQLYKEMSPEPCGVLFMMDVIYFFFKITTPIHCHYKSWKSQDIFWYNSDCIHLKEESNIQLGCLEGE